MNKHLAGQVQALNRFLNPANLSLNPLVTTTNDLSFNHSIYSLVPPSLHCIEDLKLRRSRSRKIPSFFFSSAIHILPMADSKSNPSNPASGENEVKVKAKAPNLIVRAKEEFDAIMHHKKSDSHHKGTGGLKTNNSKENASLDDIRAPNVFQRAKEEFEAIGQVLHHKKDSPTHDKRDETKVAKFQDKQEIPGSPQEKNTKKANVFERAKEEIDAFIHHDKSPHRHHKETHGRSDDIDENTPKDEVKGPNVFERVKEEIEAVVQAIHPKK